MNDIIKYPCRLRDPYIATLLILFLCILAGVVTVSVSPKFALFFGAFILLSLLIPPLLGKVHIFLFAFISSIPLGALPVIRSRLGMLPLLGLFVFGLWFINFCTRKDSLKIVPEFRWFFSLIVVMFISSWAGTNVWNSLFFSKTYIQLFILFFLMTQIIRKPKQLFLAGWIIILSQSLIALLLTFDQLQFISIEGGMGESIEFQAMYTRGKAMGMDPNESALYFSTGIPFALYYIMIYKNTIKRTFLISCLIVLTYGILCTHSTGGFIGLMSAMFFFVLLNKSIRIIKKVILFISLVPIAVGVFFLSPPTYKSRMQQQLNVIQNEDFSKWASGRGLIWSETLKIIKENPILGMGLGNGGHEIASRVYGIRGYKVAHNIFLGIAADFGIVGCFVFLMLIGSILKKLYIKLKISPLIIDRDFSCLGSAIFLNLILFFIQSLSLSTEYNKLLWLLLGVASTFLSISDQSLGRIKEK